MILILTNNSFPWCVFFVTLLFLDIFNSCLVFYSCDISTEASLDLRTPYVFLFFPFLYWFFPQMILILFFDKSPSLNIQLIPFLWEWFSVSSSLENSLDHSVYFVSRIRSFISFLTSLCACNTSIIFPNIIIQNKYFLHLFQVRV